MEMKITNVIILPRCNESTTTAYKDGECIAAPPRATNIVIYIHISVNILFYADINYAGEFVLLNDLISGTTGFKCKNIFMVDSPFIYLFTFSFKLYFAHSRTGNLGT